MRATTWLYFGEPLRDGITVRAKDEIIAEIASGDNMNNRHRHLSSVLRAQTIVSLNDDGTTRCHHLIVR